MHIWNFAVSKQIFTSKMNRYPEWLKSGRFGNNGITWSAHKTEQKPSGDSQNTMHFARSYQTRQNNTNNNRTSANLHLLKIYKKFSWFGHNVTVLAFISFSFSTNFIVVVLANRRCVRTRRIELHRSDIPIVIQHFPPPPFLLVLRLRWSSVWLASNLKIWIFSLSWFSVFRCTACYS